MYYEEIKDYQEAYRLFKKAYEISPGYLYAIVSYAEVNLAVNRFDTAQKLSDKVNKIHVDSPEYIHIAMDFISIASLTFQGNSNEVSKRLRKLIDYYRSLPNDYINEWGYKGTKYYIEKSDKLSEQDRVFLLNLIDVLESPKNNGNLKINIIEKQFFNAKEMKNNGVTKNDLME